MSYRIAGIDVHKRMLAVVVSDVEVADEFAFERRQFGTTPAQLHELAEWLIVQQAEEVVMESTAQYWKPVWGSLERDWKPLAQQRADAGRMAGTLHLAQAQSNRARPGRKRDFPDAERLVKRFVAHELTLSFVPDPAQRLWRTLTRTKCQLTRNRVQLQNRLEALLEEAHIKLSSLVSDLLGASARRMLQALSEGATDPAALAALANVRLRATQEQLRDALGACQDLNPVYRRLVRMAFDDLQLLERQIDQLDQELADLLAPYHDQVQRLAEVPGLGVDSAQQIMAEVGVKSTGSIFQALYRRYVLRHGHKQTIGIIAHRLCRLVWKILHQGVRYEERGPAMNERSKRRRAQRMIRDLRSLGYHVEFADAQ
jgi:transposase